MPTLPQHSQVVKTCASCSFLFLLVMLLSTLTFKTGFHSGQLDAKARTVMPLLCGCRCLAMGDVLLVTGRLCWCQLAMSAGWPWRSWSHPLSSSPCHQRTCRDYTSFVLHLLLSHHSHECTHKQTNNTADLSFWQFSRTRRAIIKSLWQILSRYTVHSCNNSGLRSVACHFDEIYSQKDIIPKTNMFWCTKCTTDVSPDNRRENTTLEKREHCKGPNIN